MHDEDGDSGFTLIEVIVAFIIASISLAVLYQSFSESLNATSRVSEKMNALKFIQSKIASLGIDHPIQQGETSGVSEEGFFWSLEASPFTEVADQSPPSASPTMLYVKVNVTTETPDAPPIISLTTVRPTSTP